VSDRPKRRRRCLEVRPDWVRAVIVLRQHKFFIRVPRHGIFEIWPVTEQDAWNYDVCADMEIYVTVRKDACRIRARVEQNKKFVKI
jgi:hypothetical protein